MSFDNIISRFKQEPSHANRCEVGAIVKEIGESCPIVIMTWEQFQFISFFWFKYDALKNENGTHKMYFYPKNGYIVVGDGWNHKIEVKVLYMSETQPLFYMDYNCRFSSEWCQFADTLEQICKIDLKDLNDMYNSSITQEEMARSGIEKRQDWNPSLVVFSPSSGFLYAHVPHLNLCVKRDIHIGGGRIWSADHARPFSATVSDETRKRTREEEDTFPLGSQELEFHLQAKMGIYANVRLFAPSLSETVSNEEIKKEALMTQYGMQVYKRWNLYK